MQSSTDGAGWHGWRAISQRRRLRPQTSRVNQKLGSPHRTSDHRHGPAVSVSPALPVVSGAQVVAALKGAGFIQVSRRGSPVKLRKRERTVIIPMHREVKPGTQPCARSSVRRDSPRQTLWNFFSNLTGGTPRGAPWRYGRRGELADPRPAGKGSYSGRPGAPRP
jgi:predicted RNA binding protein YcfA (HicA-like mRNA interferase family)